MNRAAYYAARRAYRVARRVDARTSATFHAAVQHNRDYGLRSFGWTGPGPVLQVPLLLATLAGRDRAAVLSHPAGPGGRLHIAIPRAKLIANAMASVRRYEQRRAVA